MYDNSIKFATKYNLEATVDKDNEYSGKDICVEYHPGKDHEYTKYMFFSKEDLKTMLSMLE